MSKSAKEQNYFIKEEYKALEKNVTLDENRDEDYWSPERLKVNYFFQWHVYKYVGQLVKQNGYKKVIDVGCGIADKLDRLVKPYAKEVIGIDQESIVKYCSKRFTDMKFVVDNFEEPKGHNFENADLILSSDVIEHLEDPDMLLNYIKSIASKDSVIVISTPERDLLRGKDCTTSYKVEHVREWNMDELVAYLEHSGFKVIEKQLVPFIKWSMFCKFTRKHRKEIKQVRGTVNTCQIITCVLK